MPGSRVSAALFYRCLAIALAVALPAAPARAQVRWTVEPKTSLVWWQISPHLNHLWATTCPEEPSWRPGENRSPGWRINPRLLLPEMGFANVDDTVNVPLFPRDRVRPVCVEAVHGEVLLPDTVTWQGASGKVSAQSEALISGEAMRDVMMHQVMATKRYPEIHFALDSLVGLTMQGRMLVGSAFGVVTICGVPKRVTAAVRAFPEAGGMRVLARWRVSAWELLHDVTPKLRVLSLGLNTNLWHDFFMGADLVFHSEPMGAN